MLVPSWLLTEMVYVYGLCPEALTKLTNLLTVGQLLEFERDSKKRQGFKEESSRITGDENYLEIF